MKDPRKFRIPTVACYLFLTTVYLIIGSVVYYYCGQHVASPALGSAGILMKKVCYGIALPGLCASLTIFNHVSAKIVFVRLLGGTKHLTRNTFTHWATWLGCTFGAMAIAYIIASAIPVFDTLLSLVGALFCPIAAIVPMILTWFHDHVRTNPNPLTRRQKMAYAFNVFILVASAFLTVAGVYAAIVDLINENSDNKPWTCNNNSGRTS
jgi:large-conductance mechanosensitive channel